MPTHATITPEAPPPAAVETPPSSPSSASPPPGPSAPPARRALLGRRFRLLTAYRVLAQVLISYGCFEVLGWLRGAEWKARRLPAVSRRNARRIKVGILELKGLFIKVGQLISALTNFLPEDFRQELEGMQDRIPARPVAEIRGRIRAELGAEPEALFTDFDPVPLASASLAQVHAARLADGRRVAVKVQHLDIEAMAQLDLLTIRRLLAVVQFVLRIQGIEAACDTIRTMILEELDFSKEAEHLEAIAANFADEPLVDFPAVIHQRSAHRVLTTTFVEGTKVTDLSSLEDQGIDCEALASRVLMAYCRMIFHDGLYHADPHPGNILVRPDGGIVFIDFGAVARLSPAVKEGIPHFLEGVLRRDAEQILEALRRMGFVQRTSSGDVAARAIDYFYARFLEGIELDAFNLQDIQVDTKMKFEVMTDLSRLGISLRALSATFQVPKDWVLLQRTLVLMMGVCTHLDPQMRPMRIIRPYVEDVVLGGGRDWTKMITSVVKEMALTAITLPGDMKRVLAKADRGELAVEVRGLRTAAGLLYALGQQLLLGAFTLGAAGLGYLFHSRGEADLAQAAGSAGGFFFLCLGFSVLKARRWHKTLRRGP